MKTGGRPGLKRSVFCLSAVALHLLFSVAAALPGVVSCHRPGGQVVIEFAGPDGTCLCAECEHCLEHLARAAAGHASSGPVLDACHCSHEPCANPARRAVLKRGDGKAFPGPEAAAFLSPVACSVAAPSLTAFAPLARCGRSPAFPVRAVLLRC